MQQLTEVIRSGGGVHILTSAVLLSVKNAIMQYWLAAERLSFKEPRIFAHLEVAAMLHFVW